MITAPPRAPSPIKSTMFALEQPFHETPDVAVHPAIQALTTFFRSAGATLHKDTFEMDEVDSNKLYFECAVEKHEWTERALVDPVLRARYSTQINEIYRNLIKSLDMMDVKKTLANLLIHCVDLTPALLNPNFIYHGKILSILNETRKYILTIIDDENFMDLNQIWIQFHQMKQVFANLINPILFSVEDCYQAKTGDIEPQIRDEIMRNKIKSIAATRHLFSIGLFARFVHAIYVVFDTKMDVDRVEFMSSAKKYSAMATQRLWTAVNNNTTKEVSPLDILCEAISADAMFSSPEPSEASESSESTESTSEPLDTYDDV